MKSNCLFAALAIKKRLGGKIEWRSGWRRDWKWSKRWRGFLGSPWGHFRIRLQDDTLLSYSAYDKDMPVWRQLWFSGYIKRTRGDKWK